MPTLPPASDGVEAEQAKTEPAPATETQTEAKLTNDSTAKFLERLLSAPAAPNDSDGDTVTALERSGEREDQNVEDATDSVFETMGTPRQKAELAAARAREAAENKALGIFDEPTAAPVLEGPMVPGMDREVELRAQMETKGDMRALLSFQQLGQNTQTEAIHLNHRKDPLSLKMLKRRAMQMQRAKAGAAELRRLWRLIETPRVATKDVTAASAAVAKTAAAAVAAPADRDAINTVALHRVHHNHSPITQPPPKLNRLWRLVETPESAAQHHTKVSGAARHHAAKRAGGLRRLWNLVDQQGKDPEQKKARKADIKRLWRMANAQSDTNTELTKAAVNGLRHLWQKMTTSEEDAKAMENSRRLAEGQVAFEHLWRLVSNPAKLLNEMSAEARTEKARSSSAQHNRIVHFLGARIAMGPQ